MTDSGKRTRAPRESRQRDAYDDFLDGVEWLEGREDAASSRAGSAAPKRGRVQGAKPAGESGTERRAPAAKAASRTAPRDGVQAAAAYKHAGALLDGKRGAAQSGAQAGGKSAAVHAGAGARSAANAQATVRAGAGEDGAARRSSGKACKKPPAAAAGGPPGAKAARASGKGTARAGRAAAEQGAAHRVRSLRDDRRRRGENYVHVLAQAVKKYVHSRKKQHGYGDVKHRPRRGRKRNYGESVYGRDHKQVLPGVAQPGKQSQRKRAPERVHGSEQNHSDGFRRVLRRANGRKQIFPRRARARFSAKTLRRDCKNIFRHTFTLDAFLRGLFPF